MYTQTDIEILLKGSSEVSEERKGELMRKLPAFYHAVQSSVVLEDSFQSTVLLLFPSFTDEQIESIKRVLAESNTATEERLAEVLQDADFQENLQQRTVKLEKLLHSSKEVIEQADEALELEEMEKDFSEGDHV